uniref:pre-mRNA 3'-end-processing factor FIP1-like isoform X3 n=1 Tax=Podarcis muralis TaxID=64176 RepID=UPI00109F90A6|nr:pre-mRNA 3'-end-processing factor FIP1-like isoform X3 [Podarcis muralis]
MTHSPTSRFCHLFLLGVWNLPHSFIHSLPGADLSDYFNYGFNEETLKAYCEKQRWFLLGLKSSAPVSAEKQIKVQQGRTRNSEKEPDFKADLTAPVGGQVKVGSPPNRLGKNAQVLPVEDLRAKGLYTVELGAVYDLRVARKLSVTIDVIGGEPGTIKRVEGRRRDKHGPEESSIQVLGDNGSKAHPTKSLQQPGPQQLLVPPTGPPPSVGGSPPSCFFLPWMPVISSPPLCHHPGMPPPAPVPGLFPPPHASPPPLSIPTHGGQSASYSNSQPPPFGYNSTAMMKGIITIAEKAATILSRTITVEIIVGSENIIIGSKGTETKRKQANTNHGGKAFPNGRLELLAGIRPRNIKLRRGKLCSNLAFLSIII